MELIQRSSHFVFQLDVVRWRERVEHSEEQTKPINRVAKKRCNVRRRWCRKANGTGAVLFRFQSAIELQTGVIEGWTFQDEELKIAGIGLRYHAAGSTVVVVSVVAGGNCHSSLSVDVTFLTGFCAAYYCWKLVPSPSDTSDRLC